MTHPDDPVAVARGSCANCRFLSEDERPEYAQHGTCRRFPPTLVVWTGQGPYGEPSGNFEQHWPWMQPHNWCGEFAVRDVLKEGKV